ncbi:Interleukin-1 receptor-like 1 [Nibea albiflora]|uniref:Interleukin-1 receptor-like 1 n=1 Tax=Nibea albiflora TaxID=240163 RepID=A0ACB7EF82_NIBAL|nr:Interleukin-1 receptor-like 1 [Nibea albiflora]
MKHDWSLVALSHSGHSVETETYHVNVGHLFVLRCKIFNASTNVTWSRWGRDNLSLPAGVEVREGLLWFITVQMSHNGSYTCEKRNSAGLSWMTFFVSVSSGECPDAPETVSISQRVNGALPCRQREIFGLNETRTVRWMKDCNPVEREGEPIFVDEDGLLRLPAITEMDAGKYTCLVDISLDGKNIHKSGKVFVESNLSISEVLPKFLHVPFHCIVHSPADAKFGSVWLQEGSVAVLALAAAFFLFKIDLALAYRKLLRHFSKQQTPDGKLHDAYVSFLYSDTLRSAEVESFALQILPDQLEKQHGYSLYIRGRDDSPGEAVHDTISATLRQCRRMIIILSTEAISTAHGETEEEPLCDNHKFCYEQKIGLYDALTLNNLQVILVEIDGSVDYSCLPESLRYIKRKQGSLKWKKPSSGTHKVNKMCSNRNFWKNLRQLKEVVIFSLDYYTMDTSRLLILIFLVITAAEHSEIIKPQCWNSPIKNYGLIEGEAFYFVHPDLSDVPDEEITWYKNNAQNDPEQISTDENKTVHYHGEALFFLNLCPENSGFYSARREQPDKCSNFRITINVFKEKNKEELLYGSIENSDRNKMVPCPESVSDTCKMSKGKLTWQKDFKLLQGHDEADLWIKNATKHDEGIYTCTCTWTHNHKVYNSSGSRRLIHKDPIVHSPQIISPTDKELFADEGFEIKLNCSLFCGINVESSCHTSWVVEKPSKNTISTAILTIEKVSAKDFQTEFKCSGVGFYEELSRTLTLKRRDSIIPLVLGAVFVLLFCVFAAILIKIFAIDLALFFRPYFPLNSHNNDSKAYDAYVIYQMQNKDKLTENMLGQFITNNLPSVLEKKCGYRLFIHGRDDIPGEDRLELVEDRMRQSRRLMIILTPGLGSGSEITDQHPASPQNSVIGGYDWQVGLHHALVQREMSVILIQLGDTGPEGYTYLPPGLQHLIRKSAPIRWSEDSRRAVAWNSRFWKRVRYLMPAIPANKCLQSAII